VAGTATLGSNLVDDLVPTVDELRADLYADMGVTQWAVHVIKRQWSGQRRNEGVATIVSDVTLTPPPMLKDGDKWALIASGRDERGEVELTGVSLTYTEAELTGGTLEDNEEWYYKLVDAQGQGQDAQYYVLAKPPSTDRTGELGWELTLKRAEITV
jgi:hypothetical protein